MTDSKSDNAVAYLKWAESRQKNLRNDNGWLTLCGLHWLEEGANSVGSDSSAAVGLPEACPKNFGSLVRKGEQTSLVLADGELVDPRANVICAIAQVKPRRCRAKRPRATASPVSS